MIRKGFPADGRLGIHDSHAARSLFSVFLWCSVLGEAIGWGWGGSGRGGTKETNEFTRPRKSFHCSDAQSRIPSPIFGPTAAAARHTQLLLLSSNKLQLAGLEEGKGSDVTDGESQRQALGKAGFKAGESKEGRQSWKTACPTVLELESSV